MPGFRPSNTFRPTGLSADPRQAAQMAAMIAGIYSPASAAPPTTLGFGADGMFKSSSGFLSLSRVHGFLSGDTVSGYLFRFHVTTGASDEVISVECGLYDCDVTDSTRTVFRLIHGSSARVGRTWVAGGGGVPEGSSSAIMCDIPVNINPSSMIAIGVMMTYTANGVYGDTPTIRGLNFETVSNTTSYSGVSLNSKSALVGLPASIDSTQLDGGTKIPGIAVITRRSIVAGEYVNTTQPNSINLLL